MSVKSKTSQSDHVSYGDRGDRLAGDERLFKKWDAAWRSVAEFYGFEKTSPCLIERGSAFSALEKAGFLSECIPISVAVSSKENAVLRFSSVLSLARTYAAHDMKSRDHPVRLYAEGTSFFAGEKEASGGLAMREERGLFVAGEEGALAEALILQVLWKTLEDIDVPLERIHVALNATGCPQCRARFRASFLAHIRQRQNRLCKTCRMDLKSAPVRILGCTEEQCILAASHAPHMLDLLCEPCRRHFRDVLEFLDEMKIPYILNARLFREGSWYDFVVFEVVASPARQQDANAPLPSAVVLAEGGGMSRAAELLLSQKREACAGALFFDHVRAAFAEEEMFAPEREESHVAFVHLGELARKKSLFLAEMLRRNGIAAAFFVSHGSMKAQLKAGERSYADIALILGQKEALDGTIIVRETRSGIQEILPQEKLIEFLRKKLKR